MAEEMMFESFDPESDEADEFWESDEAFMESEDGAEDIGERARRRRRRGKAFRPGRGVRGMTVRDADGRARNVAFPAKLATAAETNRGLASQEAARRALETRLERLETRNLGQQTQGAAISGIVTLLLGGGLTALSLFKASQAAKGSQSVINNWAGQETAKMATLSSVSQITTTGARLLVTGRYHRSNLGIAADAFAAAQVAGFALASLSKAAPPAPPWAADDEAQRQKLMRRAREGVRILQLDTDKMYVMEKSASGGLIAVEEPAPAPA
jgi:hypothetical protein